MTTPTLRPIINKQRGFTVWGIADIYTGPSGTGKYCPNLGDLVFNDPGFSKVSAVDYTQGTSTLVAINLGGIGTGLNPNEELLGIQPGQDYTTYRVYINTKVVPYRINVSNLCFVYGSAPVYVKLFLGTDTSSTTGHVISTLLDSGGNPISENLPLTPAINPPNAGSGSVIRNVAPAYSLQALATGEIVTAVVYGADGTIYSESALMVVNTDFIRDFDAAKLIIESISLVSSYISPSDSTVLNWPLNLLVQSDAMMCRVRYNNGTTVDVALDGNKASLHGINNFVASQVGQKFPLTLSYRLSNSEYSVNSTNTPPVLYVTENYTAEVVDSGGGYSVKLFIIPTWDVPSLSWKLKFYMYSLDRDIAIDVTSLMQFNPVHPMPSSFAYNTSYVIQATLNMSQVGPEYNYFMYTQMFTINFRAPATQQNALTFYLLSYDAFHTLGSSQYATLHPIPANPGTKTLDISSGYSTVADWLNGFYQNCQPLYNISGEGTPPLPTHVGVQTTSGYSALVAISDILTPLDDFTQTALQGETVTFSFIWRVGSTDYKLGLGSTILKVYSS